MISLDKIHQAALQVMPVCQGINASGPDSGVTPKILQEEDLSRIVELHESVFRTVPAGLVRHDPEDFFHRVLVERGAILGFEFGEDSLAAYGVLTFPESDEMHYGRILDLPDTEWPLLAQLEGVSVDPRWRGHNLQRQLGLWRIATASALNYRHICATAAPENFHSWRNLLSLGLTIRQLSLLYGGFPRYVHHRDLCQESSYSMDREVDVDDLAL
ncbi:MAG: hypothetical protein WCL27_17065, partial [Betaproteobacteria bacterium]